jgi:adenosylcobinamide-phosphate synthase
MSKDDLSCFVRAYVLDWLIGDPTWLPHPVRWMGRMISGGEWLLRRFIRTPSSQFVAGMVLSLTVVGTFGIGSWILLLRLTGLNPRVAFVVSVYLAAGTGRIGSSPSGD